jgi:AraC-like DNA-binding protein
VCGAPRRGKIVRMIPAPAPDPHAIRVHRLDVPGTLADSVRALVAVEIERADPLPLAIAPHDSLMLTLQFGGGADGVDAKAPLGDNTRLTGLRRWTGRFVGAGDCLSLFALLTPLGAVRLLEARALDAAPLIRAPLAALLDRRLTRALEDHVAAAPDAAARLHAFAAWLEARAGERRAVDRAALRAGRAALALSHAPQTPIERLAETQHVSRRQLERDFGRWLAASPRHVAQVARVQRVARRVHAGASLADAAADAGFADQAHLSHVVKRLTGLTPRRFVASQRTPIAAGFRAATGGGTVYL